MNSSSAVALDASNVSRAYPGPVGYILAYGVAYKNVVYEGEELVEVQACPPSATAVHAAFVSRCAFSPAFPPTLDTKLAASGMVEDVRSVAKAMTSLDVAVLFFSGHGQRMDDTACVIDSAGGVVSVRKLQAVFADTVVERGLRNVALVIILDCCQTLAFGRLQRLMAIVCGGSNWWLCVCTMQEWLTLMMIAKSSASVWLMRMSARGLWDSRPSQVSCYGGFGLCVRLVMEPQMGRHKRLQWSQG